MGTIDYIALDVLDLDKHVTLIQDDGGRWCWAQDGAPWHPQVALDCDDFQVRHREILGVLGKDGSGRSALLKRLLSSANGCDVSLADVQAALVGQTGACVQ